MLLKTLPTPYRILAVVLLAAAVWGHGYTQGLARESDRRDAVALKAEQKAQEDFMRALETGSKHAAASIEWRRKARIYYQKWQERLNDAPDTQLSECVPPPAATPAAAPVCLLSADWVGLYNDAWFPDRLPADTGGAADLSVGSGPATPREALGNVRTNAELCSEDRQRQRALIDLLKGRQHGSSD